MSITFPTPTTLARSGIGVTTTIQVAYFHDRQFCVTSYWLFDGVHMQQVDLYDDGTSEWSYPRKADEEDRRNMKSRNLRHCVIKVLAVRMNDGRLDWDAQEIIDKVKEGKVL